MQELDLGSSGPLSQFSVKLYLPLVRKIRGLSPSPFAFLSPGSDLLFVRQAAHLWFWHRGRVVHVACDPSTRWSPLGCRAPAGVRVLMSWSSLLKRASVQWLQVSDPSTLWLSPPVAFSQVLGLWLRNTREQTLGRVQSCEACTETFLSGELPDSSRLSHCGDFPRGAHTGSGHAVGQVAVATPLWPPKLVSKRRADVARHLETSVCVLYTQPPSSLSFPTAQVLVGNWQIKRV